MLRHGGSAAVTRRRKLRIVCFRQKAKAHSLRCVSSRSKSLAGLVASLSSWRKLRIACFRLSACRNFLKRGFDSLRRQTAAAPAQTVSGLWNMLRGRGMLPSRFSRLIPKFDLPFLSRDPAAACRWAKPILCAGRPPQNADAGGSGLTGGAPWSRFYFLITLH